jgi:hypothetical protein
LLLTAVAFRWLCGSVASSALTPPTRIPSICPGAHMGNAQIAPLGSCPWGQISRQATARSACHKTASMRRGGGRGSRPASGRRAEGGRRRWPYRTDRLWPVQTVAFGISAIRRALGPHSWGSLDRRSIKLGTGVTIGPATAHAKFYRPSVASKLASIHALKILTSGGRCQSGDRRRFSDYYSQNSTNQ